MGNDDKSLHIPSLSGLLPNGWHWERLDTACEGIYDCPHSTPLLTDDGPFVVRSQDIRSGVFRLDQAGRVTEDTYKERVTRAEPRYGDILYSREGTYFGIAAEVPSDVRVCLGQRMVLMRPNACKCNSRYLRYWLNSPLMASHIQGHRDGTVAERLNLTTIRQLPVMVPPLREQRAIAHILGTLDNRIELNRKMNETLESMARAIFKSWFVDFEPVRAKAEGRDPVLPSEIADLFPDSFKDSELGEVPKGWKVGTIGDLAEIVGGGTPSTKNSDYWDNGHHYWVTPKDLSALSTPVLLSTERKITDAGLKRISSGLLPVGTVLLSSRAPIGYLAIAEIPVAINQGFIALTPHKNVSTMFLLYWTSWAHDEIVSRANGSTFLEISKSSFRPVPVVVPPSAIFKAFEHMVRPLYNKVVNNERHSRTLADFRDSLLPKLISGQIRVGEAEKMLEGAL